MPFYVVLGKFTQEGIKTLQEAPQKLKDAMEVAKSFGVELKELVYTMGRYDFVFIAKAPNKEAISKMVLSRGSSGHLRTETLEGYSKEEFLGLVKDIKTL
jgi:uncharacterized protein with GYD domain